jgi:hypothetical protein
MSLFRTKNQGLAAALRYALGRNAHLKTFIEPEHGYTFLFADLNGECKNIKDAFFGDHGEQGFAVTDARMLLEEYRAVRESMTSAYNNPDRKWSNEL